MNQLCVIQYPYRCDYSFQQLHEMGSDITVLLVAFIVCIANPLMYCFFGQMATESYAKMAQCSFECNWQQLPLDLQRYLVLMMANAQRPMVYHGFGCVTLNLETFRDVRKIEINQSEIFTVING